MASHLRVDSKGEDQATKAAQQSMFLSRVRLDPSFDCDLVSYGRNIPGYDRPRGAFWNLCGTLGADFSHPLEPF